MTKKLSQSRRLLSCDYWPIYDLIRPFESIQKTGIDKLKSFKYLPTSICSVQYAA